MTLNELLQQMPQMDYSAYEVVSGGEEILIEEGIAKLQGFASLSSTLTPSSATESVGFQSQNLLQWLQKMEGKIDEVKVFFAVNEEQKLTVVFWPYKNKKPAQADDGLDSAPLLVPFNIGDRRPFM